MEDGHTVSANIRHLKRLKLYESEMPFQMFFEKPPDDPDQRPDNLAFEEVEHIIHDIRPHLDSYTLDDNGFCVRKHQTVMNGQSFSDRKLVEEVYLAEVEALLRQEDSTISRIFFFDWRVSNRANLWPNICNSLLSLIPI